MKIQDRIKMKTKSNKGITLIALVITIIVLLILAGVTIAALSGDNGILKRATEAKEQTNQKNDEETEKIGGYESTIDQYVDGNGEGSGSGGSGGGTGTNFTNVNTTDSNPAGVVPANSTVVEADANKGIVIKDKNNNEWVWIEVPKTTVFSDLTIDTTGTLTEQNYTDIKNKLIAYATTYREGKSGQGRYWTDEYYSGCGMTSDEYTEAYKKMLKSVYIYGGFWIGRYEAGIEGTITETTNARTKHTNIEIGKSAKAISQKDAIPYNYVYCSEAQALAKEMTPNNSYTSSLMFGIQWDLVCKYLEVKGKLSIADINSNSTSWGNYENAKIENIISGKYAVYKNGSLGTWTKISETYEKPNTSPDNDTLLSTGITDYTKKMNIYDFAGNEWEWTLEKTSDSSNPCARRGGLYFNSGSNGPASYRDGRHTTDSDDDIGFRPTLYAN